MTASTGGTPEAHIWWLVISTETSFRVTLTGTTETFRLYMYGPDGTEFAEVEADSDNNRFIEVHTGTIGPYQIVVDNPSGRNGRYSLTAVPLRSRVSPADPTQGGLYAADWSGGRVDWTGTNDRVALLIARARRNRVALLIARAKYKPSSSASTTSKRRRMFGWLRRASV
jgi:hypothetical protein